MGRALRKTCSFFLCIVMLSALCAAPIAATDSGGGTYAIHSVTMEDGADTAYVEVTSENDSVLFVALYDATSGAMRGVGSSGITESVVRQAVPVEVSCKKGSDAMVKAFLLNATSFAPLCQSVSAGNSDDTPYYSVVFLRNDGSEGYYDLQMVQAGKRATMPNAPERELYGFTGWYTESATVTAYDFATPVDGNLMLYAGWGAPDGSPGLYSAESGGETVYSVTGITMSEHLDEVNVTFNANSSAVLKVDFLDEETKDTLFTVGSATPDYAELETLSIPVTNSLPDYFLIHAHLEDEGENPLCEDYECISYTSQYAEFAALTIEDFAGEPVVNFDDDHTDNFGVLQTDVIWIQSTETVNTMSVEEIDVEGEIVPNFNYIFTNTDATVNGLHIGDKVYVNGTSYLFKVAEITNSGDSVVVTASDDLDITEIYDVLKVNMSNLDVSDDNADRDANLMAEIDVNVSPSTKVSHSINWNPGGKKWLTVSGSYSAEVKCDISFLYDIRLFQDNYLKTSVVTEVETSFNISAKATKDNAKKDDDDDDDMKPVIDEISFGKVPLQTPVPGVTVYIKAGIPTEWKLEGEANLQYSSTQKTGFTYDSFTGRQTVDEKTRTLKLDFKGKAEISIGPKVEVGVQFIGETIKTNVSAQAGIKATATLDLSAGEDTNADSTHACVLCLDGEAKWFVAVDAGLSIKIGKNWKADIFDVNLISLEGWIDFAGFPPGKFFFSIINNPESIYEGKPKLGFGECENKQYRTAFEAEDKSGNPVNVTVRVQSAGGKNAANKHTPFTTYLYSGIYTASAIIDGIAVQKTFPVDKSAQTVKLTSSSADGTLTGTVFDALTNNPLTDVSIVATQGNQKVAATQTDSAGTFSLALPAGDSGIRISKDGYTAYTCYETVRDGETRNIPVIRLVPGNGKGGFSGQITDATTGNPVEGVTLWLRAGWNNSEDGDILRTLTTDGDGRFEYNMVMLGSLVIHGLDAGNYTLTASKVGYDILTFNVVVHPGVVTANQDSTISPNGQGIPDDAVYFNGHAYKIIAQTVTWTEAKTQCENMGGHLVTITSQEEQNFMNSFVQDKANLFWIGLHLNQGTWEWITGEPLSYTNWGSGEPNSDFNNTEFCVDMYGRPDRYFHLGEWNDARYDGGTMEFYKLKYIHFICEWDTKEAYNTYLNTRQRSDSPFQQQYWVIFTEGYRSNRLEASTVDSTLPPEQLYIIWNRSMTLNDMSGSGRCEQYYFDNNTWVNIGNYGRLTDWATNVIASNLDIYDSGGNLIIPKTSYSDLDWDVINAYK